jgi:hypothetical protein
MVAWSPEDARQQSRIAGEVHGMLTAQALGTSGVSGDGQGSDLDDLALTTGTPAGVALCTGDMFLGGCGVTAGRGRHSKKSVLDGGHGRSRAEGRFPAGPRMCWSAGRNVERVMRSVSAVVLK